MNPSKAPDDGLDLWPEERDWLRRKIVLFGGSFTNTVRFLLLQGRLFERETRAALRESRNRKPARAKRRTARQPRRRVCR